MTSHAALVQCPNHDLTAFMITLNSKALPRHESTTRQDTVGGRSPLISSSSARSILRAPQRPATRAVHVRCLDPAQTTLPPANKLVYGRGRLGMLCFSLPRRFRRLVFRRNSESWLILFQPRVDKLSACSASKLKFGYAYALHQLSCHQDGPDRCCAGRS